MQKHWWPQRKMGWTRRRMRMRKRWTGSHVSNRMLLKMTLQHVQTCGQTTTRCHPTEWTTGPAVLVIKFPRACVYVAERTTGHPVSIWDGFCAGSGVDRPLASERVAARLASSTFSCLLLWLQREDRVTLSVIHVCVCRTRWRNVFTC